MSPSAVLPAYEAPSAGSCYKRLHTSVLGTPLGTEKIHIEFAGSERLAGSAGVGVVAQLIGGRVAYIRFNTRGLDWQQEDLATFTAKFGKPETVKTLPLQNGFGAKYQAIEATWLPTPQLRATYTSWINDKYGDFGVGSEEGERLFHAEMRALLTRSTKAL